MRIGLISPYYYPNILGGSEISARLLVQRLIKKGHNVVVISFDKIVPFARAREDNDGVIIARYKSFNPKEPLNLILPTLKAMKDWESSVDLFHIYDVFPMPAAGIYKIFRGKKKVIATLNNYIGFCPVNLYWGECWHCNLTNRFRCLRRKISSIKGRIAQLPYSFFYSMLIESSKFIDRYIALSQSIKRSYVRFGFDKRKIEVVPNFFDPNFARERESVDIKSKMKDTFNILYVGRMSDEKGVELLIRAFSYLSKKHKYISLILVGDGPRLDSLMELAHGNRRITFTGKVDYKDLSKYYLIADVFVHPSIWPEPFGRTILEALSFRIPLIVSDIGAPYELAKSSALVFKSGDISDLIKKLNLIVNNERLRKKLKFNCNFILMNYDQSLVLERIIGLYKSMLDVV